MSQVRPPTITSVSPAGVQRGNTITLTVEGANLADASAIQFSHPGLKGQITNVIELPYQPIIRPKGFTGAPIEDIYALHRVLIKLRADESMPSGRHNFRIKTPQGTTNLGSVYVGTLVEVSEIEPNNTLAEAHRIFFPSTVVGAVGRSGDEDLFEFEAEAGKTVVFEMQAAALGSPLDAELTLLDAEAKVLARNSDYNGRPDPFLAYTFSQSGTYRIRVTDSAGAGSARHFYRLNIGALPYLTRVFPLGLRKSTTAELDLEGVNLEDHQKIKVEAPANPRHGETLWIQPTARGRESQTRLRVAVGEDPEVLEQENNDTPAAAQAVSLPVTINGRIEGTGKAGDQDVFRISLKQGQRVAMTVLAQRLGSLLDSILEVVDVNGRPIPRLVARPVWQTFVTLNDPDSLRRGIRIDSWPALSIGDYVMVGNEVLQVEELPKGPDDDIKFRGYRGMRTGYEGTTPEAHSMNAAVYKVDLHKPGSTFPPNGMPLFHINYVNDDGGQNFGKDSHLIFVAPVDGDYFVRIRDIRGLQGRDFAYRLTLSEPRPDFTLSVDPPNPNIPRGDTAPLTVTATRLDGFDGPIDVQVLGLPAGVSATQGRILPGSNNVTLTLRASPGVQQEGFASFRVAGKAQIDGQEVERRSDDADSMDDSVSAVSIASPPELRITSAGPREIVLEPGQQAAVQVAIAREHGFAGRVPVEVRNLPLGVIIPDVGLNGILINENESSRTFHIQVDERTSPLEQTLYLVARIETNSPNSTDHASDAIRLKVIPKKTQVSQK